MLTAMGGGRHLAAFATFLLALSRSSRMNWRVMAVEVAAGVLQHFADPFAAPEEEEAEAEATPMQKDGGEEAVRCRNKNRPCSREQFVSCGSWSGPC